MQPWPPRLPNSAKGVETNEATVFSNPPRSVSREGHPVSALVLTFTPLTRVQKSADRCAGHEMLKPAESGSGPGHFEPLAARATLLASDAPSVYAAA